MKNMKTINALNLSILAVGILAIGFLSFSLQQNDDPWSEGQLMDPASLAERMTDTTGQALPLILAVNPDGMYGLPYEGGIQGARWFGPAEEEEHLNELKSFLEGVEKDSEIVLYCGCCPFDKCPNIRPAFSLLNTMGFTNHYLLNLPKNIREDWILLGYPMED